MANERIVGRLNIPVGIDLEGMRRDARGKLRAEAQKVGEMTADEVLKAADRRMSQRTADAKESFARKLIDRKELQSETRAAMDDFDREVLKGMERLGKSGKLTQDEFRKMGNSLKLAGKDGTDSFRNDLDGMQRWVRGTFVVAFVGAIAYAVNRGIAMFGRLARASREALETGGGVVEARTDFDVISAGKGHSSAELMQAMRTGTRGLVSDLELMRRTNFALLAELPLTTEEFGFMAEGARRLARVAGRDATEAFERLTNGIAKGEQQILEELGLMTRLETAVNDWAKANGKSAAALSQKQKIAIFTTATLEEMRRKLEQLGPEEISTRERVQQIATAMTNMRDSSLAAIAESPRLADLFETIGGGAEDAGQKIEGLANRIGAMFDVWTDRAAGLKDIAGGPTSLFMRFLTGSGGPLGGLANNLDQLSGGGGRGYQAHLDRRQAVSAEDRLQQEIRASRDLNGLLEQREKLQGSIARITDMEGDHTETLTRLQERRLVLQERIHQLQNEEPPTPPGPDPEEVAKALKAVEQWQLQQMTETERQILQLRQLETQARSLGPAFAATADEMARQRAELQKQVDLGARLASGDIPQFLLDLAARAKDPLHTRQPSVPMRNEMPIGERIASLQEELQTRLALLRVQRESGEITEEQFEKGVQEASRAANMKLLELLKTFEHMGVVAPAVLREIAGALQNVEDDTVSASERAAELAEHFVAVARGVLAAADAMGLLDDQQRKVIDGTINLAQGIESALTGKPISGTIQAIGGLIQVGVGLFGESQEDKDRKEVMKQNNYALEQLALELAGFSVTMAVVARTIEAIDRHSAGGALGMSDAEIDAVAREYGIEIRDREGRLQSRQLDQLRQALRMDQQAGGIIASGVAPQERMSTSGTVVQFSRMIDLQASTVDHLSAIRRAIVDGAYIPTVGGGGAGTSIEINVSVPVSDAVTPQNARTVGRQFGDSLARGFGERMTDAYAGAGVKGPLTVQVKP